MLQYYIDPEQSFQKAMSFLPENSNSQQILNNQLRDLLFSGIAHPIHMEYLSGSRQFAQ